MTVTDEEKSATLAKPKTKKRKPSGPIKPAAKRVKTCTEVRRIAAKPKVEKKTEVVARKTRSMDSKQGKDVDHPKPTLEKKKVQEPKVFRVPQARKAAKSTPKKKGQVRVGVKAVPAQATRSLRTRH